MEYNYITLRNNETFDPILTIRLDDKTKKFVVDKIDRSKIPSSLSNDTKVFELKLIRKKEENSNIETDEEAFVARFASRKAGYVRNREEYNRQRKSIASIF